MSSSIFSIIEISKKILRLFEFFFVLRFEKSHHFDFISFSLNETHSFFVRIFIYWPWSRYFIHINLKSYYFAINRKF